MRWFGLREIEISDLEPLREKSSIGHSKGIQPNGLALRVPIEPPCEGPCLP
jgi:hypothetical protein